MYLSRVEIDYKNRLTSKELNHLGAFHNWVEQSFPKEIESNKRSRKLWRIDNLQNRSYLLVLSEDKPDLNMLEKYGVKGTGETKDYSEFLNSLESGDRMRFRVVLNTTKSISNRKFGRGKVIPLTSEEDQIKYFLDRSEKNGFELHPEDFYLVRSGFEKVLKNGEQRLDLIKAEFQGELTIIDIEKFKDTLVSGIGKKKAYGFGMITVIPM